MFREPEELVLEDATLRGIVVGPKGKAVGRISLVHAWNTHTKHYAEFLEQLAQSYEVVSFDTRGFGASTGIPDWQASIEDARAINANYGTNVHVGLSIGAGIAANAADPDDTLILMQPCLDRTMLSRPLAAVVHGVARLEKLGIDRYGHSIRAAALGTLHTDSPVHACKLLDDAQLPTGSNNTLYFMSDSDNVLARPERIHSALERTPLRLTDASALVAGCNHWLNYTGAAPIFKDEPGKDRQAIVERITSFLQHGD